MREIKFRAWDKRGKKMYRVKSIDFNNDIVNLNGGDIIKMQNIILMQYTGLKNKNGVEIYELDVVEQSEYTTAFNRREVVKYEESGYFPFAIPHWEVTLYPDEVEVIGNICANPELLEELDE